MQCKDPIEFLYEKKKIMDMMTTGHSTLRDYYNRIDTGLDCVEFISAVIVCGTTFYGYGSVGYSEEVKLVIGIFSMTIFSMILIKRHLDLKTKAEKHNFAAHVCSNIKIKISNKIQEWCGEDITSKMVSDYMGNIYIQLDELVPIPENKFLKLKHKHQRKVEFSKSLDKNRKYLWITCKIKFMRERNQK